MFEVSILCAENVEIIILQLQNASHTEDLKKKKIFLKCSTIPFHFQSLTKEVP